MPPAPASGSKAETIRLTIAGVLFACLSTSLGGTTFPFIRLIIVQTDPFTLVFARYGIALLCLAGVMAWRREFPAIARRDMPVMIILAVLMFTVFPALMARALADTTSARGALVFGALPVVTLLIGAVFGVERITFLKIGAIAATIAGIVVALGGDVGTNAPNALRGDILMFFALLAATAFNIFAGPYLKRYGTLPVFVYSLTVGTVFTFVLAVIFGRPFSGSLDFDAAGWGAMLFVAIPAGAVILWSWGMALQRVTPTQVTVTVGLNPIVAILLGPIIVAEPITLNVVAGLVLIVLGIVMASLRAEIRTAG